MDSRALVGPPAAAGAAARPTAVRSAAARVVRASWTRRMVPPRCRCPCYTAERRQVPGSPGVRHGGRADRDGPLEAEVALEPHREVVQRPDQRVSREPGGLGAWAVLLVEDH